MSFEVAENGKPQRIPYVLFVPGFEASTGLDLAARQSRPTSLRAQRVTRTKAIVVDDLGLSDQTLMYVRRALESFVETHSRPGDLVAIITSSGRLAALHRLTADKTLCVPPCPDSIRCRITRPGCWTMISAHPEAEIAKNTKSES